MGRNSCGISRFHPTLRVLMVEGMVPLEKGCSVAGAGQDLGLQPS